MSTHVDVSRMRLRVAADLPIAAPASAGFAAQAIALATAHGAALGPVLDVVDEVQRATRRQQDEIAAALAPVRSVAMALGLLPVVLVPLLARLVALDLAAFYATGAGRVVALVVALCWGTGLAGVAVVVRGARRRPRPTPKWVAVVVSLVMGLLLHPLVGVVAGVVVWRRRGVAAPPPDLAEALELVAIGTSAGLPLGEALRVASAGLLPATADGLRRIAFAGDLGRMPTLPSSDQHWHAVADLADDLVQTGGPPTAALRMAADHLRADELTAARVAAARLPTRLTVPTVLGLLPATVLAIGAPLVAAGLEAAV